MQLQLGFQVALWPGPWGISGPWLWISHWGEETLSLCSSCPNRPHWISPPGIGAWFDQQAKAKGSRQSQFWVKMSNVTFWGAACSSVGGPMMFSLTKIWTHAFPLIFTKCLPFSLSTNYTLSQNCAKVGSIRPAAKVVHHNCSGFLRVPVKNHYFHWILRRPAFDWDDMTKR